MRINAFLSKLLKRVDLSKPSFHFSTYLEKHQPVLVYDVAVDVGPLVIGNEEIVEVERLNHRDAHVHQRAQP